MRKIRLASRRYCSYSEVLSRAHLARAAVLAISVLCSGVSLAALALPPLGPPRRPRVTAAGFFGFWLANLSWFPAATVSSRPDRAPDPRFFMCANLTRFGTRRNRPKSSCRPPARAKITNRLVVPAAEVEVKTNIFFPGTHNNAEERQFWALFGQEISSGTESSNPPCSATESWSLGILRSIGRNRARLRLHSDVRRHRRKAPSGSLRATRGRFLCWRVRRFHPRLEAQGTRFRATRRVKMCASDRTLRGLVRRPQLVLARSRGEGDRSVRPRPRRSALTAAYRPRSSRRSLAPGTPTASIV